VLCLAAAGCGGGVQILKSRSSGSAAASTTALPRASPTTTSTAPAPKPPPPRPPPPRAPFAVGERIVRFVDRSRLVEIPGHGLQPRTLITVIRYPAHGSASHVDVMNAPPQRGAGRFPLVIFGHGFSVTPEPYAPLLRYWARGGYVVAAPIFPLGNANAPGGPNESDLPNQPGDMSFVITRLLHASASRNSFFAGMIDAHAVAVSGQSDGGDTALTVAYNGRDFDPRVRAAVILSGMEIPGMGGYEFTSSSPPLLATQGTADTINPPSFTYAFFDAAQRPKYLLSMFGASHIGPYSGEQPWARIVERVTVDFLNAYLKGRHGAVRKLLHDGDHRGLSSLVADR